MEFEFKASKGPWLTWNLAPPYATGHDLAPTGERDGGSFSLSSQEHDDPAGPRRACCWKASSCASWQTMGTWTSIRVNRRPVMSEVGRRAVPLEITELMG